MLCDEALYISSEECCVLCEFVSVFGQYVVLDVGHELVEGLRQLLLSLVGVSSLGRDDDLRLGRNELFLEHRKVLREEQNEAQKGPTDRPLAGVLKDEDMEEQLQQLRQHLRMLRGVVCERSHRCVVFGPILDRIGKYMI